MNNEELTRKRMGAGIHGPPWRIMRDWFYDPNMHGVDWNAIRAKYAALVPS